MAEAIIRRVQFFLRKASRVTSGSTFFSVTCVGNRRDYGIEWMTEQNVCGSLVHLFDVGGRMKQTRPALRGNRVYSQGQCSNVLFCVTGAGSPLWWDAISGLLAFEKSLHSALSLLCHLASWNLPTESLEEF